MLIRAINQNKWLYTNRVYYISVDYSENRGDRDVVEVLNKWSSDQLHKISFVDMSKVASGSMANDPDCKACDLKKEIRK